MKMNIGQRISRLRKAKNLSQQELAKQLYLTDKTISSWESGRTEPKLSMVVKLSEILDCSAKYLICGERAKSEIKTEIKIRLLETEYHQLKVFMDAHAEFINESHQVDTYYQPNHRKFVQEPKITEWLRVGQRGNKKLIDYEKWHGVHSDRYEIEIDDIEKMETVFQVVGLEEIAVVDKMRRKYVYLNKYEIALDVVKDLGRYVEIEVMKYDKSIEEEYNTLLRLARKLNLSTDRIDKLGYAYYMLKEKKNCGEGTV